MLLDSGKRLKGMAGSLIEDPAMSWQIFLSSFPDRNLCPLTWVTIEGEHSDLS